MEKILSILLVIVPIGTFILGYYLCNKENKLKIQHLKEDHIHALTQKNLVHIAALEKFSKDLDTIKELKDGRIEMLERQLIDNAVIGTNVIEPEQVNKPWQQTRIDNEPGYAQWLLEHPEEADGLDKFLEDKHPDHRLPYGSC